MKKVLLILGVWLIGINSAVAEIYHGIDIDEVFATSDWNSKDEIKDIFLERFPYKNIISNVIVDEDGIEKLIKMINDSLYMPGIEFVVIPTITPGINLSDITEEQLNSINKFLNNTSIEPDDCLDELLSFKFDTMIFDKEQSYDDMYNSINEVFEACTIENDDNKIIMLPFDVIILSYYTKE